MMHDATPTQRRSRRHDSRAGWQAWAALLLSALLCLAAACARPAALRLPATAVTSPSAVVDDELSEIPWLGDRAAPITMVVYNAYGCATCDAFAESVLRVLDTAPDLRVVYHVLALDDGAEFEAAVAARAALVQGRFAAFHRHLVEGERIDEAGLVAAARQAGVDMTRWQRDRESAELRELVEDITDRARRLGLQGVPTFVLGGEAHHGGWTEGRLRDALASEREAVAPLVAEGLSPDAILEARLAQRSRQGGHGHVESRRTALPALGDRPARGNTETGVLIVEFSLLGCPACERQREVMRTLLAERGDDVHHVLIVVGAVRPERWAATGDRALRAAHRLGAFWELYPQVAFLGADGPADMEAYAAFFEARGLDAAARSQLWSDPALETSLEADLDLMRALQVEGFPTLFVDGRAIRGFAPRELLDALLQEATQAPE